MTDGEKLRLRKRKQQNNVDCGEVGRQIRNYSEMDILTAINN